MLVYTFYISYVRQKANSNSGPSASFAFMNYTLYDPASKFIILPRMARQTDFLPFPVKADVVSQPE